MGMKLSKFEAGQILMNCASTLTAGVLANPASAGSMENSQYLDQVMETSVKVSQRMFKMLDFEIEE